MPRRRSHAPGPATEVIAPMQAKGNARPRRRPVARHPGIYYRPRAGGRVQPPYEVPYLDSSGTRRWAVVHGSLDEAEAKRAELRLRRRRGERIQPTRQTFEEYAREWLERQDVRPRTREIYTWALEQHLIPRLGRRRLDQISCDDVAALIVAERGQLFTPGALVFASRNETGLVRKVAREALKRAVKAAKLAAPEPTLHDLRHSHASMLIALDVSVVDVQCRLGHRKPDTTLRVYAHQWKEREARRSEIGEQLGQLFAERKALPAPASSETRLALPPAEGHDQ